MVAVSTVERRLFGGALTCQLPESWVDVSDMRQVPDHQECWLDKTDDTMVVVEIVEYQTHVSDSQAVAYFLQDLAEANGLVQGTSDSGSSDKNNIVESMVPKENLAVPTALPPTAVVVAGRSIPHTVAIGRESQENKVSKTIRVDLCAIRLPHVTSEILVTVNTPTETINTSMIESSPSPSSPSRALDMAATLRVHDWGLFEG